MKTDKISFGTKPQIGDMSASISLPKYKKVLTDAIYDTFTKWKENGINDEISFCFGPNIKAKKRTTDVLNIDYFTKNDSTGKLDYQSSINLSPRTLEKKSKKELIVFFEAIYSQLQKSNKKVQGYGCSYGMHTKITKAHQENIDKLLSEFGFDDWGCA